MDQQQRARIRERNRRKRRKQVFYARIAAFLIVAALLVGIFFAVRGVMALTGDKNSVTTFQEIENRLFRRKKKVYTKPEMTEEYLTVNPYSRPGEKLPTVKSVFVHYTANAGTSAMQNRSYFENLGITGETSASAHFIIGYEGEIVQCLPLEEIGYAVKGRNYDSVSIECCYLEEDGKIIAAMSLIIRRAFAGFSLMYAPRAPICDFSDTQLVKRLLDEAKPLAKKYRAFVLRFDPELPRLPQLEEEYRKMGL